MSIQAVAWALECDCPSTASKLVLVALANYADEYGECFPSLAKLAQIAGTTRQNVSQHIKKLSEAGLVAKQERERRNGSQASNVYVLSINGCQAPLDGGKAPVDTCKAPVDPILTVIEPSLYPSDKGKGGTERAFDLWNECADRLDLPKAQKLTAARKTKIKARLKDCGGLEGWAVALSKIEASAFLVGENDRGWKADLDFMLQESSFTKLMEDRYAGTANSGKRAAADPEAARRADLEAIYDSIRPELESRDGLDGQGGKPAGEYGNPAGAGGTEAVSGSPESGPGAETEARDTGGIRGGDGAAVPVCADVRSADGRSENADGDLPGSAGGHSAGNPAPRHNADHGGPQISIVAEASGHSRQCVDRTGGGASGLLAGEVVSEPVDDLDIPDFLRRAAG